MEDGQADQGCHYHGEGTNAAGCKSGDVELLGRVLSSAGGGDHRCRVRPPWGVQGMGGQEWSWVSMNKQVRAYSEMQHLRDSQVHEYVSKQNKHGLRVFFQRMVHQVRGKPLLLYVHENTQNNVVILYI